MKTSNETFVCVVPVGGANVIIHKYGLAYQVYTDHPKLGVGQWPDHLVLRKEKLLDAIVATARKRIETHGLEIKLYGIPSH